MGGATKTAALTPKPVSVQSLDSCMELDSLRERIQQIHMETEGREDTRLLQQDREEGEGQEAEVGVQDGSLYGIPGCCFPTSILIFSLMYGLKRGSWAAGGGEKAAVELPKEAQQGLAFDACCSSEQGS